MQIVRTVAALREAVRGLRGGDARVALVPTMGALHAGHLALVAEARRRAERVVVSIFVNPKQFAQGEDLDRYPRREAADAALLEEAGADLLWAPAADEMYPNGFATAIVVAEVTERWEGEARPGHFAGVATVVAKLFGQVRPDIALFGEKDWQQLAVVRRMAADLDLGVEVIGMPTVREADGLALSSRNAYLSAGERSAALVLPGALREAAQAILAGKPVAGALANAEERLRQAGFGRIDYLALVDGDSLDPIETPRAGARLIVAAFIGTTRLIDNMVVTAA